MQESCQGSKSSSVKAAGLATARPGSQDACGAAPAYRMAPTQPGAKPGVMSPGARRKADLWHAAFHCMNNGTACRSDARRHPSNPPASVAAPQLQERESKSIDFTTKARKVQREKFASGERPAVRAPAVSWAFTRPRCTDNSLLDRNLGAAIFEFLLDGVCLVLGDVLLDGLGAPSTSSLASLRPRLVISRTTLMTLIFLAGSARPSRTTVNSVCSAFLGRSRGRPDRPPSRRRRRRVRSCTVP